MLIPVWMCYIDTLCLGNDIMVLITKSFLVKVLMEVQKKLYLSSYFLLRKGGYPQSSTESGYVCVCRGGNYEAASFSHVDIFRSLSLSHCSGVCMLFSGYFPAVDGALPQGRSP